MSDQFGSLFNSLRGLPPPGPFAPAAAVRRRGRQRANRQAVSVGIAVLAVTGLGAGGLVTVVGQPDQTGPPAASPTGTGPTASPSPTAPVRTEIPLEWLLAADDLGPGEWVTGFDPEWTESDPPWLWGNLCAGYQAEDYPSLANRIDLATIGWTDGPWEGEGDGPPPNWVHQVAELFGAEHIAAANMMDVRNVVGRCAQPGGEAPEYEVVDSGFAGDESLLVLERMPGDISAFTAVVRVGDAVTTLRSYDVELAAADDEYLLSVAERAAARFR